MTKMQKIWLWIFGGMFVVPEVLFFTTPMMIRALYGRSFTELSSRIINYRIFFDHPNYLLIIIGIETIGVISLLIMNFKLNKKFSIVLPIVILLIIAFIWLTYIFALIYGTSRMSFF